MLDYLKLYIVLNLLISTLYAGYTSPMSPGYKDYWKSLGSTLILSSIGMIAVLIHFTSKKESK